MNVAHFRLKFLHLFLAVILVLAGAVTAAAIVYRQSGGCSQFLTGTTAIASHFSANCPSALHSGKYARYYSFALASQSQVTISLTSSDADTFLYLLSGSSPNGAVLYENDDVESGNTNSRISATLSTGTYTVEATTYGEGETGTFTLNLTVQGGGAGPIPTPAGGHAFVAISSGPSHVCGLRGTGDIECHAVSSSGAVASATVYLNSPAGDPFIAFDSGDGYVCGLTAGGTINCGSTRGGVSAVPVPTAAPIIIVAPTPTPAPTLIVAPTQVPGPTIIPVTDPTPVPPAGTGNWVPITGSGEGLDWVGTGLPAYQTGPGDGWVDLIVTCFNSNDIGRFTLVTMYWQNHVSTSDSLPVSLTWDSNPTVTDTWSGHPDDGTITSPRLHPNLIHDKAFIANVAAHDHLDFAIQGDTRRFEAKFNLRGFQAAYGPVQDYCNQGQPASVPLDAADFDRMEAALIESRR